MAKDKAKPTAAPHPHPPVPFPLLPVPTTVRQRATRATRPRTEMVQDKPSGFVSRNRPFFLLPSVAFCDHTQKTAPTARGSKGGGIRQSLLSPSSSILGCAHLHRNTQHMAALLHRGRGLTITVRGNSGTVPGWPSAHPYHTLHAHPCRVFTGPHGRGHVWPAKCQIQQAKWKGRLRRAHA
jgi:hypothetical protein